MLNQLHSESGLDLFRYRKFQRCRSRFFLSKTGVVFYPATDFGHKSQLKSSEGKAQLQEKGDNFSLFVKFGDC